MSQKLLKVIAGAPDHPLTIGDIEIPCYVLEDETRVLSQGGFLHAIGRTGRTPTNPKRDVYNLPHFLSQKNLKSFIPNELVMSSTPILFQSPSPGKKPTGIVQKFSLKCVRCT